MALLDHQVPKEAKAVTAELLQLCVGDVCVVKYMKKTAAGVLFNVTCGMVTSMSVPENKLLAAAKITLYQGASDADKIAGDEIEYIYSLSMLPDGAAADMQRLVDPGLQ